MNTSSIRYADFLSLLQSLDTLTRIEYSVTSTHYRFLNTFLGRYIRILWFTFSLSIDALLTYEYSFRKIHYVAVICLFPFDTLITCEYFPWMIHLFFMITIIRWYIYFLWLLSQDDTLIFIDYYLLLIHLFCMITWLYRYIRCISTTFALRYASSIWTNR